MTEKKEALWVETDLHTIIRVKCAKRKQTANELLAQWSRQDDKTFKEK